jgi:hypothetical protein
MHLLPGTTFSSTKERGEYDSEAKAIMTLGELEVWFALQITGGYHDAFHRGWMAGPSMRGDGTRIGRTYATPEIRSASISISCPSNDG